MKQHVAHYVSVLAVFLAVDFLWLGFIAGPFYRAQLGPLLKAEFNLLVAGAFYAFYAAGIVVFAVQPAVATGSAWTAIGYGAFLGALAYGTYDLTNLATIEGYSATVAFVDLAWGTFLTALAAAAAYLIVRRLEPLLG